MPDEERRAAPIGRPKRYDNRVSTGVRFPEDVFQRLHDAAEERDLSVNWLVVRAVREFLDRLIPVDEIQWTRTPREGE